MSGSSDQGTRQRAYLDEDPDTPGVTEQEYQRVAGLRATKRSSREKRYMAAVAYIGIAAIGVITGVYFGFTSKTQDGLLGEGG